VNSQLDPSSDQGSAPKLDQMVPRFSHRAKSKSRTTSPAFPLACAVAAAISAARSQVQSPAAMRSAGSGWPAAVSWSVLTNTPNGLFENG
jgi:hypothetical protein